MPRIFISYRRDDAPSQAGRLCDRLREHFGDHQVFRDVDAIRPGRDFVDRLERELASAAVLLAVIGPRWSQTADPTGRRRLDDKNDYVRLEIERALSNEVPLIPVLINETPMPTANELPPELRPLTRANAVELTDRYWRWGVEELIESLETIVGSPSEFRRLAPEPPESAEDDKLSSAKAAFASSDALAQFLAKRGVAVEELGGEIVELLKQLGAEAPLEATTAAKPDYLDLSGNGPFGLGESKTQGVLVATTTRLLFVIVGRAGVGFNVFAYDYSHLRQVGVQRSSWRLDLFRPKRLYGLDLALASYTQGTECFRIHDSFEANVSAILGVVHSRTEDGVVDLTIPARPD